MNEAAGVLDENGGHQSPGRKGQTKRLPIQANNPVE
jgi:hypothetical protein